MLPAQAVANIDTAQRALLRQIRPASLDAVLAGAHTSADGLASLSGRAPSRWSLYASPLARYEAFDAKTAGTRDIDGWGAGLDVGAIRHFGQFSLGFSGYYLRSRLDGSGYESQSGTYGTLAVLRYQPQSCRTGFSPWVEAAAGYAFTDTDQDRRDALGGGHNADLNQHTVRGSLTFGVDFNPVPALRFTPIAGLDYTWTRQGGYREDGGSLRLDVRSARLNSLRLRVGGEAEYGVSNRVSLLGYAFLRQELGDRQTSLNSRVANTPIRFVSRGEKYGRSSGNFGLGLSYRATETLTLSAVYDAVIGDHQQGHQINLGLGVSF